MRFANMTDVEIDVRIQKLLKKWEARKR